MLLYTIFIKERAESGARKYFFAQKTIFKTDTLALTS